MLPPTSVMKEFFSWVISIHKNWTKAKKPIMVIPMLDITPMTSIWKPRTATDLRWGVKTWSMATFLCCNPHCHHWGQLVSQGWPHFLSATETTKLNKLVVRFRTIASFILWLMERTNYEGTINCILCSTTFDVICCSRWLWQPQQRHCNAMWSRPNLGWQVGRMLGHKRISQFLLAEPKKPDWKIISADSG